MSRALAFSPCQNCRYEIRSPAALVRAEKGTMYLKNTDVADLNEDDFIFADVLVG